MRRIGTAYRIVVIVLKPLLRATTIRTWRGGENLPREGGFVVAVNHTSHVDPFTFGHFLYDHQKLPRFLIKDSVFGMRFFGWIVRDAQQIPVYRNTATAGASLAAASTAVRAGECVCIYPEGTVTRDPDLWPMRGKTGAVRLALETGAPLVPIAQWGAQDILPPYSHRPKPLPRHRVRVSAGPPVDLSPWRGLPLTPDVLAEATAALMLAITLLLAEIRGERPPDRIWDPREHDLPLTGNPNVTGNPNARPHGGAA